MSAAQVIAFPGVSPVPSNALPAEPEGIVLSPCGSCFAAACGGCLHNPRLPPVLDRVAPDSAEAVSGSQLELCRVRARRRIPMGAERVVRR